MKRLLWIFPAAMVALAGCGGTTDGPGYLATKTLAGTSDTGAIDGPAATATFDNPVNAEVGPDGTIYVADFYNGRIRTIKNGVVGTLVQAANFQRPFGLTIAPTGDLYVQTDANDSLERSSDTGTIWRVNTTTGALTVVVRNVGRPRGLLALADGRIVLSDVARHQISLLNPTTGVVTELAGKRGGIGYVNGTGLAARFYRPYGLAQLPNGDLLVADQYNYSIRRVTLTGVVTTYAGIGQKGSASGALTRARFMGPQDVAVDASGNVYVADTGGFRIRLIARGQVSNLAGDGVAGYREGIGAAARFYGIEGFDLTPDGSALIVADGTGGESVPFNRVRRIQL